MIKFIVEKKNEPIYLLGCILCIETTAEFNTEYIF